VAPGRRSSFAWRGQPLPFVPYQGFEQEMQGFATGAGVRFLRPHEAGRAAHPQAVAPARIRVEDYAGPVLVIGGGDDQVCAAGRETLALVYPEAGHAVGGPGWSPTTGFNLGPMKMGGQPAADGRAAADAWPKTVEFLRRTLGPVPD
jgi:dienelactone hydrolase